MMRLREEPYVYEPAEETEQRESAMRFFPLEPEGENKNPAQGRQRTVNPLAHRQNPLSPHSVNMAGQRMPQMPQMNQPQQPQKNRIPYNQIPQPEEVKPSPERAVEQFSRINKNLPDGVHYEPLDEQTLKLLREKGHLPAQQPSPKPTPMPSPPAPLPPVQPQTQSTGIPLEAAVIIEGLLQNSRNAQIFYTHMAKTAENGEAEGIFTALSMECRAQTEQYNAMLARYFNRSFTPNETEINTRLSYEKSLTLALTEENKAIDVLSGLLYTFTDAEAERVLQRIINKKIAGYNRLLMLERVK